MSITGGIKFFDQSQNLSADGATITSSSGNAAAIYAIDRNPDTKWFSVSSNDTITETVTIVFDGNKTITRILLLDHNWKEYTVQYDVAGVWTNFTSVIGLDGSLGGGISETVFADNTSYYEFTSVITGKIRLQIVKTQIANAQKYISQIISTSELGTLVGYPEIGEIAIDRNERSKKTLSGRYVIQKSIETQSYELNFKDYPSSATYNADVDLIMILFDRETPFLVWLCGGRRGSTYFRYTLRGFRLKDVYLMQLDEAIGLNYTGNIYTNPLNMKIKIREHI